MVRIEPIYNNNGHVTTGNTSTPPSSPSSAYSGPLPHTFPYPAPEPSLAFPIQVSWPIEVHPFSYDFGLGHGFGYVPIGYPQPGFYDPGFQPWVQQPTHVPVHGFDGSGPSRVGNSDRAEGGSRRIKLERGTTTLMIRNLPTKLRRDELMNLLDEHCRDENKSAPRLSRVHQSAYDFLYLPFDFKLEGNLGYGFVNFTTGRAAYKFFMSWSGRGWLHFHSCTKICEITRADIQGKDASRAHLERSTFYCNTDEYLPVEFSPPRNGYNAAVVSIETFGIRVVKNREVTEKKNGKMKNGKIWRKKEVC